MKIAQLSTRYPPGPGGVERHVGEVSRRLVARGHDVTAFSSELYREFPWERLAADVPRSQEVEGVHVRRLPVWTLPGELHYPFFRGLGRALDRARPEIVHAHTYGTNHAAVARRYARQHRAPFILTAHYHPIWSIEGGWLRHRIRHFYDHRLAAPIIADASRLIVQTAEEERLIRENGFPLPQVSRVPPGYSPLPPPLPGERPFAEAFRLDGPFVLFVGRLASNKGLLVLADAFDRLARSDPAARLVVVGADGGTRPALERRARDLGIASRVTITGHIEDERLLASGFREARLLALPSEYEAFGLVLLEALAHGTPVVSTRVGGIPEFIEDGKAGVLVPPGDAPALSDALARLWADEPLRSRLGEYGRDEVVPKYTWERVTDQLEAIYREVRAG